MKLYEDLTLRNVGWCSCTVELPREGSDSRLAHQSPPPPGPRVSLKFMKYYMKLRKKRSAFFGENDT